MIIVKATLEAKPGQEKVLENFLKQMVEKVRQEPETLTYTLHRCIEKPSKYFFFEEYPNEEAFKAHLETPYFAELVSNIEDLLLSEAIIETYERVKTL